jgi:hypothetical protein
MPESDPEPETHARPASTGDPTRARGEAPVPDPPPKRQRWLDDASGTAAPAPPEQRRDPTLDLPIEERTPVDPWADADPLPVAPPPVTYPPTRPYTAAQPPVTQPPPAVRPAKVKTPKPPTNRPVAAPPGWRPPAGYVAVPVRRRRKWPWVLLLSLACCCGCPAWLGRPLYEQYPSSASLPDRIDDLTRRDDSASERAAAALKASMQAVHWVGAENTFAGIYTDPNGKNVTVFGTTGFHLSPDGDAQAEIDRLTDDYDLEQVAAVETGVRGEARRCGVGADDGDSVVVCTWVDYGSLGTGVFTRLDRQDSNALLNTLRDQIVTRGK